MRFHAPLLLPALSLIGGILLSDHLEHWPTGLFLLAVVLLLSLLLYRFPRLQSVGICVSVLLLGMTLGSLQRNRMNVEWPPGYVPVEAAVVAEPVLKEKTVVLDLLTTGERPVKIRCRMMRDDRSERIALGDGLSLRVRVDKVHAWRNGHFDYQRYMSCHGFTGETFAGQYDWQSATVSLSTWSVVQRARLRFLLWRHALLARFRQWKSADEDVYGVIAAMTLGEKSHLSDAMRETYSRVGASHILALSGLHLGIVYFLVTLFVGWRRFPVLSQTLVVSAIWAFAFLVGLPSSVVRSATMITVYALLSLGYRERMSVNTLAFTAIVMLVANPSSLYDVGFQLSFSAVLAILLLHPLSTTLVPPHVLQRRRWLAAVWGITSVSLSAQVGTAPLVAYYFGRFSTWFLLSNWVVVPLATIVLYLTLAAVLLWWWTGLQRLVAVALWWVVSLMNRLLESIACLPLCSIEPIRLTELQLVCVYVLICCVLIPLCRKKIRR